jgi:uncharacterized protein YjbI with pentapeptide repeats
MASKRQALRAEGEPAFREIVLGSLDDVDGASLRPADLRELERLSNADLEDRDLHELRLISCEWVDSDLTDADLRGSRFDEVVLDRISATVLRAAEATWQDVHVRNSRIGSAEFYESEWRSVQFTNCKIGYLNLRHATLTDVRFRDCQIDEIDLGDATVTRAAFPGSTLTSLDLRSADLVALDLRGLELSTISGVESISGAWVDESQLVSLAPILARHLGLRVVETEI